MIVILRFIENLRQINFDYTIYKLLKSFLLENIRSEMIIIGYLIKDETRLKTLFLKTFNKDFKHIFEVKKLLLLKLEIIIRAQNCWLRLSIFIERNSNDKFFLKNTFSIHATIFQINVSGWRSNNLNLIMTSEKTMISKIDLIWINIWIVKEGSILWRLYII